MSAIRRAIFIGTVAAALLFLVACGGSDSSGSGSSGKQSGGPRASEIEKADHAGVLKLKSGALEEAGKIVGEISDLASAKKAVPALNALADRLDKIKARARDLGTPAPGSQGMEYGQSVMKLMNDFNEFARKASKFLDDEEIAAVLDEPMKRIFEVYEDN